MDPKSKAAMVTPNARKTRLMVGKVLTLLPFFNL